MIYEALLLFASLARVDRLEVGRRAAEISKDKAARFDAALCVSVNLSP